jgi:hypothetical protein
MITRTVNKIARNIDGMADLSDDELLALVKKAYRKTAKIASRGVWGFTKDYASASGAIWRAYGHNMLSELGYSQDWQDGFAAGFESTGTEFLGSGDFNAGFAKGKWIADQVFHHWPDSPDIYSVPEDEV